MTPPVLTAFYAGLCALLFMWQTFRVIILRTKRERLFGDGGDKELFREIRGQANSAEQMPLILLMLGLAEMLGAPAVAVHVLGAVFFVARVIHALYFMGDRPLAMRGIGILGTLIVSGVLALGLIAHGASQAF